MNDPVVNAIKDQLRLKKDTAFSHSQLGKSMILLLNRIEVMYNELHREYRVRSRTKCEMYEIPFAPCTCGFDKYYMALIKDDKR